MKKKKKKVIDWKGIEKDYRAGKTSIRQIAEWYGVSEGAVRKRAKAHNWSQMIKPAVEAEPDTFRKLAFIPAIKTPEEAKSITRSGRTLAVRMLDELKATTSLVDELEDMIISETAGDRDARRRTAMLRAVNLPERANTLKTLALAAKTFTELVRLDAKPDEIGVSDSTSVAADDGDDWDRLLN